MSPTRTLRIFLGIAGFAVTALLMQSSLAQVKPFDPTGKEKDKDEKDQPRTDEFGFNISEIATKKIASVKNHLKGKAQVPPEDWKDLIFALQGLLDEQRDSLVEIEILAPNGKVKEVRKVSVRREVNQIIATIFTKEGRDFYQSEVGPIASDKLKKAIEANDFGAIADISERYFHTKSGAEATALLGKHYLDRGRYQSAAETYRRFTERSSDEVIAPNVLFMAALAHKRLALEAAARSDEDARKSYEAKADDYWKRLQKDVGNREVKFGTRSFTLAQLETEYNRPITLTRPLNQNDWYGVRGNMTNNAQGNGSRPFLEPLWDASMMPISNADEKKQKGTHFDWIDQELKRATAAQLLRPNIPPLPAFFPVAASGKVLIRTYEGVECILTRDDPTAQLKAGDLLWRSDCTNSLLAWLSEANKKASLMTWMPFYYSNGPAAILSENGLLGSLSHDGTNVYFVDELPVPPHPQFMMQQFGFGGQPASFGNNDNAVKSNRLRAVNMETGKKVWEAGSNLPKKVLAPGEEQPETSQTMLSDAIFLGPPLPLAGKLYVVLEKDRELRLVCLDPTKVDTVTKHPELLWSQPLGSPNVPLPTDTLRRIQGLHLAYSDNVLVCPTNAGAVLGVDLLSHSLIWAKSYRAAQPISPDMQNGRIRQPFPQPGMVNQNLNQDRWRSSTPIIANGKVIFTAYDANSILCLNLRDGEQLWEVARGSEDLFVAGVFENRVMVVSRTGVRFLDLNDKGKQIGNAIATGVPSGVGTASHDIYYLPIKASPLSKEPEIWSIDVLKGEVLARTKSRKKHETGNLIFFDGGMFSQTAEHLTCFPQLDVKIREMQARLKANDKDPIGLAEMGDLLLDDGKLVSAIETLDRCLENKPNDDTRLKARDKLYEAITELLQNDFNTGEKYLANYEKLCEIAIPDGAEPYKKALLVEEELRRKSNRFCLIAKGKEAQGKLVEAFDNYLSFGALSGSRELVPSIDQPGTLTRPDVWALGRINHMLEKATPEQRAPLEAKAAERWAEVKKKGELAEIRGFVRVFGSRFAAGNEARLLLADKLIATNTEDDSREAENILLGLKALDENEAAARATECLARLYIRKGLLDDAVGLYADLGKNYPKIVVRDGKTGGELFNELITDKRFLPFLEPLRTAFGQTTLKAEVTSNAFNNVQPQQSFTIEPDGQALPFFNRHRVMMDMNYLSTGQWALRLYDRVTGEERMHSQPFTAPQFIHMYPQSNSHRFAQLRGHLLILNLGSTVYAYDLSDRSAGRELRKLWEYNLLGKSPVNTNPVRQEADLDGVRLYYEDGWTQKVGQVGVVEASYVCLITRDGLVAVDPAKGNVLWTKSLGSSRIQLSGDANHVFAFQPNVGGSVTSVRAIRASDGVEIPIPDSSAVLGSMKRAKAMGRHVLVMDDTADKKAVRYYDLLTGKDIWTRPLSAPALMLHTDAPDLCGYVTEQGDVAIFNLKDGKEVFKSKMDAGRIAKQMEKVNEAILLVDRERYFIVLNRPIEGNNFNQNSGITLGIRTLKVNGVMYAFDRSTSKRLWFTDEQFENQQIILEQFQEVPVVLACHQHALLNGGVFIGTKMTAVALDKQTGKTLVKPREIPQTGQQFYALLVDPIKSTIEFVRPDFRIKFLPEVAAKP